MKKNTFKKILVFLVLLLIVVIYLIINTSVSLKYETDPGDCISKINGYNLCFQISLLKIIAITCGITFVIFIWLEKRILRNN